MTEETNIGKRLKVLREISGLNQSDVAAFLKRDRSMISMVESGYARLPEKDEQRLAEYLEEKARARVADLFPMESAIVS